MKDTVAVSAKKSLWYAVDEIYRVFIMKQSANMYIIMEDTIFPESVVSVLMGVDTVVYMESVHSIRKSILSRRLDMALLLMAKTSFMDNPCVVLEDLPDEEFKFFFGDERVADAFLKKLGSGVNTDGFCRNTIFISSRLLGLEMEELALRLMDAYLESNIAKHGKEVEMHESDFRKIFNEPRWRVLLGMMHDRVFIKDLSNKKLKKGICGKRLLIETMIEYRIKWDGEYIESDIGVCIRPRMHDVCYLPDGGELKVLNLDFVRNL